MEIKMTTTEKIYYKLRDTNFNADGSWVNYPPTKYQQTKAKKFIEEIRNDSFSDSYDKDGYHVWGVLLTIANPYTEF
jgi:hypothetical protein